MSLTYLRIWLTTNRLKKEYQIKIREINQLNEEKKTMQLTISRLNKKVQSLKARNNSKTDNEEGSKNDKIKIEMERIKWKDKGEMMLKLKDLPSNLEFKNSFLKKKYLSKLTNLMILSRPKQHN